MENIVNEVENMEQDMDLNDPELKEDDVKIETVEEKKENPYEGYRVSKGKVFGILGGLTAVIGGGILLFKTLRGGNDDKPTEEGVEEVAE